MAQDATGALYLSDASTSRVFRVGLDGVRKPRSPAEAEIAPRSPKRRRPPATNASLTSPRGLLFDSKGNLDIAEAYCKCIVRVSPAGIISTVFTVPQQPGFFQYFRRSCHRRPRQPLCRRVQRERRLGKSARDGLGLHNRRHRSSRLQRGWRTCHRRAIKRTQRRDARFSRQPTPHIADTMNNRVRRIRTRTALSSHLRRHGSRWFFSGDGGSPPPTSPALQLQPGSDDTRCRGQSLYLRFQQPPRASSIARRSHLHHRRKRRFKISRRSSTPQAGDGGPRVAGDLQTSSPAQLSLQPPRATCM